MHKLSAIVVACSALVGAALPSTPAMADRVTITESGFADNGRLVVDLLFSQPGPYYTLNWLIGGSATFTSDAFPTYTLSARLIDNGFSYLTDRSFSINFYKDDDHDIYILSDAGAIEDYDFHYALVHDGNDVFEAYEPYTITHSPLSVPEPTSWALMLAGFGLLGAAMRRWQRDLRHVLHEQPTDDRTGCPCPL